MEAAQWIMFPGAVASVLLSIAIDLGNGFPGEGVFVIAYTAPVTIMAVSVLHVPLSYLVYNLMCLAYIVWVLVFAAAIGMDDFVTPQGANLAALFVSIALFVAPWYTLAFVFLDARRALGTSVRKRVESCMATV